VCLLVSSCGSPRSTVDPTIEFTTIPLANAGGPAKLAAVAGRVTGARPGQQVVVFAKTGGVWWVQPFRSRPFTAIEDGSTWTNSIHLGTEYAALLVNADYRPPATTGSLPDRGRGIAAVARATGTGTFVPPARTTLAFSGYEWEVRQQPNDRYGMNDYDARNVWVYQQARLHLLLSQRDGRWTSAEVWMTRSLGYGTYSIELGDTSQLDPAAALSVYTWDALGADQNFRELTVDVSRWGDPASMNGQYVVQPENVAANVFRFAVPAGRVTHSFRWEPGRVSFRTVRSGGASRGDLVAERLFTVRVPTAGAENPHIVLLYDRGSPKPPSKDVEVVVEKFAFLP